MHSDHEKSRGTKHARSARRSPFWPRPRRRSLAVTAAACVVGLVAAGLSACGSSGSSNSSGAGTLKIITWVNPPAVKAIKTIDAEFHKKYPKINVQLQTAANVNGPYAALEETSVDAATADIVTNVLPVQPMPLSPSRNKESNFQYWASNGVFEPLNGQPWLKNFTPSATEVESYKGQTDALESGFYQEGVFYNKAIFAKYHLSVPTDYNQFLAVCKTLKAHNVTPLFDGLGDVGPIYLQFLYWPLMADLWYPYAPGHNLALALEKGTDKWTDPHFTTVMEREKAIAAYLEPNYTGVPWESMPGQFAKGSAAMLLDGSWDLASVHQANPGLKVGFFPLPGSDTASLNQPFLKGDLAFAVLKHAPNKAAAMKWLAFFATPKIYDQYVDITGISPSQKTGTYSSFSQDVMAHWFGKGVNYDVSYPALPTSGAYWDETTNWSTPQLDVIQGKMTPQQAEAKYQSGWQTG
jgi:raffinose/stachyose/melibiose transport system substrate-binding protein